MLPKILDNLQGYFRSVPSFDTIVDLGCGFGVIGPTLKTRCNRLIGVDQNPWVENTVRNLGYDEFIQENIVEYYPKIPSGTVVCMFDVIEHLPKELGYEILNFFKENNNPIILTTPSKFCDYAEGSPHVCVYSEEELRSFGFEIRYITGDSMEFLYGPILFAVMPKELMRHKVSVIVPLSPEDSTDQVSKTFKGADEIIAVKGGTVGEARNCGAERARNPYLLFVDSDMDLQGMDVGLLPSYGLDVGAAYYDTPYIEDKIICTWRQNVEATFLPFLACVGGFIYAKKEVWENIRFNNVWIEDIEFAYRCMTAGYIVGSFPMTVVHTRKFTGAIAWLGKVTGNPIFQNFVFRL